MAATLTKQEGDGDLIPTRQSLLSRLRDWDDQAGWKEFFDSYWKLIYQMARRSGLNDPEAQDVVQETIIGVCKGMRTFEYRREGGSFKGWLRQLTRWRIADHLRRRLPAECEPEPGADGSDLLSQRSRLESIPDPSPVLESQWDEEWQRNQMDVAIERVKRRVDARQYQIFDLYVLKQWPVKKVAATLGVTAAQVYLARHRIAPLIRREVHRLESRWK